MSNEMIKLREWLNKKQISWEDMSDLKDLSKEARMLVNPFAIYRTRFMYKGHRVSVIHGFGTYGGWSFIGEDKGLLEMMIDGEEPIGYLTAKEVKRILGGLTER